MAKKKRDDDDDEIKFLTFDTIADPNSTHGGRTRTKLDPVDQEIYRQSVTRENLITIKSKDELEALGMAAALTKKGFDEDATRIMNARRADEVRRLRVDEGHSWRAVAHACYDAWSLELPRDVRESWMPPSNQLMGMALCEAAARFFFEDPMQPPWN
jgi:hypothetical protein